jgi:hypothetical protein
MKLCSIQAFLWGKKMEVKSTLSLVFLSIQRAFNAKPVFLRDMCVNHCCLNIGVSQKLLNRPDIISGLKQVRGKRVPKRMNRHPFFDAG